MRRTFNFRDLFCGIFFSAGMIFPIVTVTAQDAPSVPAAASALEPAPAPTPVPVSDNQDIKSPMITPIPGGYHIEWSVLTEIGGVHLAGPLIGKVEIMFDVHKDNIDKKPEPATAPEVLLSLADYWIVRGKPSRAIPLYQQGLVKDPENILFQNNLAMLLSTVEGKHEEGLKIVDAALEKMRDNVTLLDTKGMILMNDGRWDEAVPVLERAVELSCQHPIYCMHLARALDLLGRVSFARNWFDKCRPMLEATPDKLSKENKDMFDVLRLRYPQSAITE
jgi:hypothetical protein